MNKVLNNKIKFLESLKKPQDSETREGRLLKALFAFEITFKKTKKIHITGTNGKGSTVAYLSKLLTDKGYFVGTFTSPYIYNFNERIKINNENISDEMLLKGIEKLESFMQKENIQYSFFEAIFLISLIIFNELKLDFIIIEVGIGGLYDCTNILHYDYAGITNIGLDHKNILGDKNSIFVNKIGVFKPLTRLFTTMSSKYIPKVQKLSDIYKTDFKHINIKNIKIISKKPYEYMYENNLYKTNSFAKYEVYNSILAVSIFRSIVNEENVDKINNSLLNTNLIGRFEIRDNLILDGAHNEDAFRELLESLKSYLNIEKSIFVFSQLSGKEIKRNISIINKYYKNYYYFIFDDQRIIIELPENFKGEVLKTDQDLLNLIKNNKDKIIIITGSIHLLGYINSKIK